MYPTMWIHGSASPEVPPTLIARCGVCSSSMTTVEPRRIVSKGSSGAVQSANSGAPSSRSTLYRSRTCVLGALGGMRALEAPEPLGLSGGGHRFLDSSV